MKNKKKVFGVVASILVVAIIASIPLLTANAQNEPVSAVQEAAEVNVKTQAPETGDLILNTDFIGKIEPTESISIFPKLSGTVTKTYFEVGETVKKGDLLFELDPEDVKSQVAIAEAGYNLAQASVEQALGGSMDMNLLQSDTAYRNAERGYDQAAKSLEDFDDDFGDTVDDLYDAKEKMRTIYNAAQKEYETAAQKAAEKEKEYIAQGGDPKKEPAIEDPNYEILLPLWNDLKSLHTTADTRKSEQDAAKSAYNSAYAQYSQADSSYDSQKEQLETVVENAYDGYLSAKGSKEILNDKTVPQSTKAAQAQLKQAEASYNSALKQLENTKIYSPIDGLIELKGVTPNNTVSMQSPSYTVSNKEMMIVSFNVAAGAVQTLNLGDLVSIESGANSMIGTIIEIASMVDPQSGLFKIKARIDSTETPLYTGMTVKVKAATEKAEKALLIPISVVYFEDNKPYVYIADGEAAHKTWIQTGVANETMIEVTEGLDTSSQVITTWHPNLIDGALVKIATTEE